MRTVMLGDIHGCFRELLEKLRFCEEKDRLISLGDLMDRGEESYEVFSLLRDFRADGSEMGP